MENKEIQMKNTVDKTALLEALKLIKMTCIGSACVLCPLRSVKFDRFDKNKCAITEDIPANWSIKTEQELDWRAFQNE